MVAAGPLNLATVVGPPALIIFTESGPVGKQQEFAWLRWACPFPFLIAAFVARRRSCAGAARLDRGMWLELQRRR